MDIRAVKKYKEPNYPTKEEVFEKPDILKLMPNRWKNNVYVGAALSTLLVVILSGCESKGTVIKKTNTPTEKPAQVAPIFEHGKDRGSFGCDSIAPPSFISEDEAFQVVQEEAKNYNMSFEIPGIELKNIALPNINLYPNLDGLKKEDAKSTHMGNLTLDGYDDNNKIGFEFISAEDYRQWQAKTGAYATVENYDFLEAAKVLREGINKNHGASTVGVFYNPMIMPDGKIKLDEAATKKLAKEELRKQVKDFLQWLKAQGII